MDAALKPKSLVSEPLTNGVKAHRNGEKIVAEDSEQKRRHKILQIVNLRKCSMVNVWRMVGLAGSVRS